MAAARDLSLNNYIHFSILLITTLPVIFAAGAPGSGSVKIFGHRPSKPLTISESFQAGFCFDDPIFVVNETSMSQSFAYSTPSPTVASSMIYVWRFFDAFGSRHLRFREVNQSAAQICIRESVNIEEYRTNNIRKVIFGVAAARDGVSSQLHFVNNTIDQIWLININDIPPRFVNVSSHVARIDEGTYENKAPGHCVSRFRIVDEDFSAIPVELKTNIKSITPPALNSVQGSLSPSFRVSCNSSASLNSNAAALTCCLLVSGVLDFELVQSYVIELEASDGSSINGQTLSDRLELVVVVQDVDDTPPVFSSPIYTAVVAEDKSDIDVVKVSAHDGDIHIANPVVYSIIGVKGSSTLLSYFSIDPKTGMIRLVKAIDRESTDVQQLPNAEVKLEVEAREVKKSTQSKSLSYNASSVVSVVIKIADVDDNDPLFSSRSYAMTALWSSAAGAWTIIPSGGSTIRITDLDESTNAAFRIAIKPVGDNSELFTVVPPFATGSAFVDLIPSDNETLLQTQSGVTWSAEIKAEAAFPNSKGHTRFSTATVTVLIQPANTEAPRFEKKSYLFAVNENAEQGMFVGKVVASDADHDRFGVVTYVISATDSVEPSLASPVPFELDPLTGVLTVNAGNEQRSLDREAKAEYLLFINAVDGGGLTDSTVVRIRLTDINDNGPVFLPSSCSEASIAEETIGIVPNCVLHIFDPDASPNNDSVIHIASVNLLLKIGSSGDSSEPSLPTIIDSDVFRLIRHYDPASSGVIGSRWVLQITKAVDLDKLRFHVPRGVSGITVVIGLRAEDLNSPVYQPLLAESSIRLTFTDINDNAPECFTNGNDGLSAKPVGTFYIEVFENVTSVHAFAQIGAWDADEPASTNAEIVFSWTTSEQGVNNVINYRPNPFVINPETGEIGLSPGHELDKDLIGVYNLSVRLQDLGSPPQNSSCSVIIRVLDVNNKPPRFSPAVTKYVSITENSSPEKFLAVMSAEDPDVDANLEYTLLLDAVAAEFGPAWTESSAPNALKNASALNIGEYQNDSLFPFMLSSPLPAGSTSSHTPAPLMSTASSSAHLTNFVSKLFSLDKHSGFVHLLRPLDREMLQAVRLPILVRDLNAASETPPQTATGTLVIQIVDVNDSPPRFDHPESIYLFEVRESTPVGSRIGSVKCIDSDSDDATFIEAGTWGDRHVLDVTPIGDVFIKNPLDYEQQRQLNVTVTCTDRVSHRALAIVAVSVLDDNDCIPIFSDILSDDAYAVVAESATIGTVVRRMEATDCDSGEFGLLAYFIIAGNENGHFTIDTNTGVVSVAGALDAENVDNYELTVLVKDNPYTVLSNQSHKATKRLQIAVSDINDCTPTFSNHSVWLGEYNVGDLLPGTTIKGTPTAVDCDKTANNSQIRYSIAKDQFSQPEIFTVDSFSGRVSVAQDFNKESLVPAVGGVYTFALKATDNGRPAQLSSIAIISLSITGPTNKFVVPDALLKTASITAKKASDGEKEFESSAILPHLTERTFNFAISEGLTKCFDRIALLPSTTLCCRDLNYTVIDSSYASHFSLNAVDSTSFDVCVIKDFDREAFTSDSSLDSAVVYLKLLISGAANCSSKCVGEALEAIQIKVEIFDINDNQPTFTVANIVGRAIAPAFVKDGQFVANLKEYLHDRDTMDNLSTVHFEILPANNDRHQVDIFRRFLHLDQNSGVVSVLPASKRASTLISGSNAVEVSIAAVDAALTLPGTRNPPPTTVTLTVPIVENVSNLIDIVVRLPLMKQVDVFHYGHANILPESDVDRQLAHNFTQALNDALAKASPPLRINEAVQTVRLNPLYSDHHLLHIMAHGIEPTNSHTLRSTNAKRTATNEGLASSDGTVNGRSLATALARAYRDNIAVAKIFAEYPVIHIYPIENVTINNTTNDLAGVLLGLGNLSMTVSQTPDVLTERLENVQSESPDDEAFTTYMSWAFLSIVIVSFLTMSILILVAAFVVFRQKYHRKMRALEILLTAEASNRHQHHRGITTVSSNGGASHHDDKTSNSFNGEGQYFDSRTLPAIIKAAGSVINEDSAISNGNGNGGSHVHSKGVTRVHYSKASSQQISTSDKSNGAGLLENFRTNGLFSTFLRPIVAYNKHESDNHRQQLPGSGSLQRQQQQYRSNHEHQQEQNNKPRRLFSFCSDNISRGGAGSRGGGSERRIEQPGNGNIRGKQFTSSSDSGSADDSNVPRTISPADDAKNNMAIASPLSPAGSYAVSSSRQAQVESAAVSFFQQQHQSQFNGHNLLDDEFNDAPNYQNGNNNENTEYCHIEQYSRFPYIDSTVTSGVTSTPIRPLPLLKAVVPPVAPPLGIGQINGNGSLSKAGISTVTSGYVYSIDFGTFSSPIVGDKVSDEIRTKESCDQERRTNFENGEIALLPCQTRIVAPLVATLENDPLQSNGFSSSFQSSHQSDVLVSATLL